MTPRLSALLDRLAPVARAEILRDFRPDCCIATASILRRVFRHFHFKASPIPVEVVVVNPRMVELLARGVVAPSDPVELAHWFRSTRSYSVGITRDSASFDCPGGFFAGHLVLHVQDVLVDASLDQANRPAHGIELPPLIVTRALPGFLAGEAKQTGILNGCEVQYRRLYGDGKWRTSPDWTDEARSRRAVHAIIEGVCQSFPDKRRLGPTATGRTSLSALPGITQDRA